MTLQQSHRDKQHENSITLSQKLARTRFGLGLLPEITSADEVTTTVDFNTSPAAPQFEVLTQPGVLIETPEDRFRVKEKPPVPHKIVSPNSERLQAEPALGETITDHHHLPSPRHHSTPRETTNVPEKSDTFEHIDSTQSEQVVEEGDVTEALIDEGNPQTHQEIQESAGNNSVGVRNRGEHGGDSELSLTTTSTKTTHKAELNRRVTKKDLTELLKQEAEELEYIREAYRSKRKAIRRIDALLSKKGDLVQTMSSASSSPSSSLSSSQALSVTVTECFSSLSQPPIRQESVSREGSVSSSSTTSSSSTVKVSHHRRKIETGSRLFPLFETPSSTQSKEASSKRVAKQPDVERMYQEYIQSFDRKTGRITGSRKDSNKTKRPKSPVYEIFRRAFDEAPKTASVSSTEKLTKCPRNAPLVKYSSSKHADTVSTATTSSSGKPYYVILEVKCPHHHHHNKHRHDRNRSSSAHQHHHHHKKEDEFHVVRCEKSSINSVSEKSSSSGVKLLHQPSKQKVKKSHRSSAEQSSPLPSSYRQHHHRQKQGSSTEDLFFNSNDVTEVRVNRGGCSWIECPPRKPSPQKASSHHPHRRRPDVSSKDTDMVAQFASEWRPAFRDYGQDPFVRNNVTRTNPPYGCDLAPNSNQHNDSSIQLSSQSLQEAFRRRMQAFIARSEARQRLIRLNARERRLKADAASARFANYFRQLSWHPQGSTSFQSTGNRKSVSWARNVRDHGILKPRKGSTIVKRLVPLSTKTR